MRNGLAAALPLAVALFGTADFDRATPDRRRVRVAATAARATALPGLTEEQQGWLETHNPFGIPRTGVPGDRTLVVREGYSLAHNNVDLIADWVAFRLTRDFVNGNEKRPGSSAFKPDPVLRAGRRAELSDYKGWGGTYDRGHQCAAGDSKGRGTRVIRESFFLSNMTPQTARLNQHKWRLLEDRVQKLADARGELWVLTGPIFRDDDGDGLVEYTVIGANEVAVPTHYYKIVVAKAPAAPDADGGVPGARYEAMAFLVPNEKIDGEFDEYLVSVDEIEELTGFDFLVDMDDALEAPLEAKTAASVWPVA